MNNNDPQHQRRNNQQQPPRRNPAKQRPVNNQARPRQGNPQYQSQQNSQYRQNNRLNEREKNMRRAEEARRAEAMRRREKMRRQAEFRSDMKALGGRILVFFVVLAIILLVFGIVFLIFFHSAPDKKTAKTQITYYYGGSEVRKEDLSSVIDTDQVSKTDSVYFCFNDLADYLGFYESGSAQEMTFIYSNSIEASETAEGDGQEEKITFYTDKWRVNINGQDVRLDIPNRLSGDEIWVSTQFITDYMENIAVEYNSKKSEIRIARVKEPLPEGEDPSKANELDFLPFSFKLKWANVIKPIEEDPTLGDIPTSNGDASVPSAKDDGSLNVEFETDLSSYEKYMNPQGNLRDSFLTLVNTTHTLTEQDVPSDLMDVKHTSSGRKTVQLREYACKALDALYLEMNAAGYTKMGVHSAYRTYTYQASLFDTYTKREMQADSSLTREEAEKIVLTYSTRPGTSEHQTGLAVDMDTLGTFTTDFEYEPEYTWLQENAWKFGFILRFPKDKVDITTIQFEPWHYRFVGRYHAKKIHDSGLCLEEYIERLNKIA